MTIKRRLYISNFLMLVIPVFITVLVGVAMVFALVKMTGLSDTTEYVFMDLIGQIERVSNQWTEGVSEDRVIKDVLSLENVNNDESIKIAVYKEDVLVYPASDPIDAELLDAKLIRSGDYNIGVKDNQAIYKKNINGFSIILVDTDFQYQDYFNYEESHVLSFEYSHIIFIVVIIIILLTNQILTRFIFKSIMVPLNTLVYGVKQIRDGNLSYHIQYEGKDEFAGVCSDFNEMAEKLLEAVNTRQKEETNRRELIAGISHDLRTPLTSIKAYVEGIEKGVASTPEKQEHYLNIIKSKTADLEHIVNQLFLFSKLDIGEFPFHMESIDIGQELSDMVNETMEEYEQKGLALLLIENVKNIFIQVDVVQLRNAIINILENSVKYKEKEQGEMRISCRVSDGFIKIILKDNGPGVPDEIIPRLFDLFYRADTSRSNPTNGSGLGLAITSKILERLGGSIHGENLPEGGFCIVMILPQEIGGYEIEENTNY